MASERDGEHVQAHLPFELDRLWVSPTATEGTRDYFTNLVRQDDNGVRTVIGRWRSERAAECMLAHYDKGHHKQTYWLERAGAT
jgi:hypothetical protein